MGKARELYEEAPSMPSFGASFVKDTQCLSVGASFVKDTQCLNVEGELYGRCIPRRRNERLPLPPVTERGRVRRVRRYLVVREPLARTLSRLRPGREHLYM